MADSIKQVLSSLQRGVAIPAMPLALDAHRKFDERRQRALIRYYIASEVGGLAVAVHTTQFEIRDHKYGLHQSILRIAAEELQAASANTGRSLIRVAGICGNIEQAIAEATLARELGYHLGLVSLAGLRTASISELVRHCRRIADILPVFGFYLQPSVGGRELPYLFWRQFAEIEQVAAIKIAAFDRYKTLDVVRAVVESGRDDIALYTGNDDNIIVDLLTPFRFEQNGRQVERRIVGGLLGHWAVWTRTAVQLLEQCRSITQRNAPVPADLLSTAAAVTDCNAAFFDSANAFRGCIPGIHEVLRRQGLLEGTWCLDQNSSLSPGQSAEIDRVCASYPELADNEFVAAHIEEWLSN